MTMVNISCQVLSKEEIVCDGTKYELPEEKLTYEDKMFWVYIGVYTALVLFAGLMSGLTMGLLSLDLTTLKTMKDGGSPKERKYAKKILPVISRHHLLLVTLLLANAVAVEAMPIFLDRVSNPIIAIVISVTAVLIFGEVIPQAVCTRFGLAIGAYLTPLVYFMMAAFFIIAYPLSKILDCCLGTEHGTFFRRAQLKALIDIHGEDAVREEGEGPQRQTDILTHDEVSIIKGALDMKSKTVKDAMIAIEKVYMLNINARLNSETMAHIIEYGHSRIPVYRTSRSNIISLMLTKRLIMLDPDDGTPVESILHDEQYAREALFVEADLPLFELLNIFQTGKSHLAIVREPKTRVNEADKSPTRDQAVSDTDSAPLLINISEDDSDDVEDTSTERGIVGIITLEDIIEELLQEEIEDETDVKPVIQSKFHLSLAKSSKENKLRRSASLDHAAGAMDRRPSLQLL